MFLLIFKIIKKKKNYFYNQAWKSYEKLEKFIANITFIIILFVQKNCHYVFTINAKKKNEIRMY